MFLKKEQIQKNNIEKNKKSYYLKQKGIKMNVSSLSSPRVSSYSESVMGKPNQIATKIDTPPGRSPLPEFPTIKAQNIPRMDNRSFAIMIDVSAGPLNNKQTAAAKAAQLYSTVARLSLEK